MSLHTVKLYNKVNITPDYSIVTDLSPSDWLILLNGGNFHGQPVQAVATKAWEGQVNWYRLPDVLRIEAPYDDIRKVTYGSIEQVTPATAQEAFETPMFFFVKKIRLVKEAASSDTVGGVTVFSDIVELEISVDVWSSNYGRFELYDSFVERRHMDRWVSNGATPPVYTPLYYPNAAQGVEGSMRPSIKEDITKPIVITGLSGTEVNLMWIVVSALDTDGKNQIFLGVMGRNALNDTDITIFNYAGAKPIFGWKEVMDGSLYNALNLSADFIQSICVVPSLGTYWDGKITLKTVGGELRIVVDYNTNVGETTDFAWIIVGNGSGSDAELMNGSGSTTVNVVAPDASYNAGDYDADEHEPMMYRAPAMVRKVVSGYGGTIFDVPDIAAFESTYSWKVTYDLNGVNVFVFAGSDVIDANAIGGMGAEQAATLPIFNSAWKSYEAISKVGDDIAYKAHQVAAVGGGIANTTISAAGGFLMGGTAGAVLGAAGGITGTATSVYANIEELKAKRTTIKNSPCNVKSGGSGLGATIDWRLDFFYLTLQMDDQTMEKLRSMYYWYGYHVERTMKGAISLNTRKFFDFIKTSGARVRGDMNAEDLGTVAAIFDKGVTIFHVSSKPYYYGRILQAGIGDKRYNNDEVWL